MASTGEVACFGRNKYEAFLKSYLSVPSNFKMPKNKVIALSGALPAELGPSIKDLLDMGFTAYGVQKTLESLFGKDFKASSKLNVCDSNHILHLISKKKTDITFNFPEPNESEENYFMRRKSVDFGVPLMNNVRVAQFMIQALKQTKSIPCESYEDYYESVKREVKPTNLNIE